MAFVVFNNHKKPMTVPHDKAQAIQRVLDGQVEGTAQQQDFAMQVKKIYFSRKADWKHPAHPDDLSEVPFNELAEKDDL